MKAVLAKRHGPPESLVLEEIEALRVVADRKATGKIMLSTTFGRGEH